MKLLLKKMAGHLNKVSREVICAKAGFIFILPRFKNDSRGVILRKIQFI